MADAKKVEQVVEVLKVKAAVAKRVFATPDGQELLEILRREFFRNMKGKDEHETVFKAGQADVVAYLMQLQNLDSEGR
jgi:hypothetical protein